MSTHQRKAQKNLRLSELGVSFKKPIQGIGEAPEGNGNGHSAKANSESDVRVERVSERMKLKSPLQRLCCPHVCI